MNFELPKPALSARQTAHYYFLADCIDTLVRMRTLPGCRVWQSSEIAVVCRIVRDHAAMLACEGYDGLYSEEHQDCLRKVLAADERAHPDDYASGTGYQGREKRAVPRDGDDDLVQDFIDPQIGPEEGNMIAVSRRTRRLRDRGTLEELDAFSEFFLKEVAGNPDVCQQVVVWSRWQVRA